MGISFVVAASRVIYLNTNVNSLYTRVKDNFVATAESIKDKYTYYSQYVWIRRQLPAWNFYLKLLNDNITSAKGTQKEIDETSEACYYARQKLQPIKIAAREIVGGVFEQYIQRGKILELGSNLLDGQNTSPLGELVSESNRQNMIYSDKYPMSKNIRKVDATNLKATLKSNSEMNITALCVFDLISRHDFKKVVTGLYHALKPNGRIIILSDLPFSSGPLIAKYTSPDTLILPSNQDPLSVKIVPIDKLKQGSLCYGPEFLRFVETLIRIPREISFDFLLSLLHRNDPLCLFLEQLCPVEDIRTINNSDDYKNDLEKAFEDHKGFKILANNFEQKQVVEKGMLMRGRHFINHIASDLRKLNFVQTKTISSIEWNKHMIDSTFYVFVAEKKSGQKV